MAFPSSPTNGQIATIGGITYTYNSTKTAWIRTPSVGANLNVFSTVITGSTSSTSTTSGALQVTGGTGIQGNLNVGGSASIIGNTQIQGTLNVGGEVFIGNAQISTKSFAIAMSIGLG